MNEDKHIYVVQEEIDYEPNLIMGIYDNEVDAKNLKQRLENEDNINYDIRKVQINTEYNNFICF
ncbi:hypothetical protein MACA111363_02700 [Macrococcoides canis]|uniref:Uncharacterized protein n=1 Tax=Macrococcoides canis TaxID=1855823 RepID=A0A1W7ABR9_9STAP|nr:hypothetical protein [Macrococcus canis]ARQ07049.1 hypothetical protein MCCS_14080 [Macrococcus canis]QIH78304.1 hypothetical protein GTN30_06430 [Macrococcus canis]